MYKGIWGCHAISYSTCTASGALHYTTFDGRRYDFTGTCAYQMVGVCLREPALTPFVVMVENNNRGSVAAPFAKAVTLEVYNLTVSLSQDYPRKVQVQVLARWGGLEDWHHTKDLSTTFENAVLTWR